MDWQRPGRHFTVVTTDCNHGCDCGSCDQHNRLFTKCFLSSFFRLTGASASLLVRHVLFSTSSPLPPCPPPSQPSPLLILSFLLLSLCETGNDVERAECTSFSKRSLGDGSRAHERSRTNKELQMLSCLLNIKRAANAELYVQHPMRNCLNLKIPWNPDLVCQQRALMSASAASNIWAFPKYKTASVNFDQDPVHFSENK